MDLAKGFLRERTSWAEQAEFLVGVRWRRTRDGLRRSFGPRASGSERPQGTEGQDAPESRSAAREGGSATVPGGPKRTRAVRKRAQGLRRAPAVPPVGRNDTFFVQESHVRPEVGGAIVWNARNTTDDRKHPSSAGGAKRNFLRAEIACSPGGWRRHCAECPEENGWPEAPVVPPVGGNVGNRRLQPWCCVSCSCLRRLFRSSPRSA